MNRVDVTILCEFYIDYLYYKSQTIYEKNICMNNKVNHLFYLG